MSKDCTNSSPGDEGRLNSQEVEIRAYLDHILRAAELLTVVMDDDDDAMEVDDREEKIPRRIISGSDFMDKIARCLLTACNLSTLTMSTSHLPARAYSMDCEIDQHLPVKPFPELPPNSMIATEPYQHRRVDYLRRVLRAMAPISFDVAAHVCSMILRLSKSWSASSDSIDGQQQIPNETAASALILFSTWLPVAPHLTALVSQLWSHPSFSCPLTPTNDTADNLVLLEIAQAVHTLCYFYVQRREQATLIRFTNWNWSILRIWMKSDTTTTNNITCNVNGDGVAAVMAIRWYAVRALGYLLGLSPSRLTDYYETYNVQEEQVQWVIHPWELDHEEAVQQRLILQGKTVLWKDDEIIACSSAEQIRCLVPLHPYLIETGPGLVFCRHDVLRNSGVINNSSPRPKALRLIRTSTTQKNLDLIGGALTLLPQPPPILLCGPPGSGKSSLIRDLACLFSGNEAHDSSLLELHVDDETDTKTLIGSYTSSDKWGEFEWRPGALTLAVRQGRWVLMENIDKVPAEIHASLTQLLEERLLPLGSGKVEMCHPNFRLFGTLTVLDSTAPTPLSKDDAIARRLLNADLWHKIFLEPLPSSELKEIAVGLYSTLPDSIVDSTLSVFQSFYQSAYDTGADQSALPRDLWLGSRYPSVRDLFKILSRIHAGIPFERDSSSYTTERQRTLCLTEVADVLVGSTPDRKVRRYVIQRIAAPKFGLAPDVALQAVESRSPTLQLHSAFTEIGRVRIELSSSSRSSSSQMTERQTTDKFATTDYTLRLIESIGVCVRENEPVLLVGETGCGKTSVLQELARLSGRELVVQNLSLQTDATDLLGGYRPLEIKLVAKAVYRDFVDLFSSTFSRKQNAKFLEFASNVLKREKWDKLSHCFMKAAKMGLSKVEERRNSKQELYSSAGDWERFSCSAERFEQQRLACDTGMAFIFTEGALVDAVRRGKWVLLDEINLASSETLQRLCGLVDDRTSSLTLTERGDSLAIDRNSDFRLFAAMNPATDAGKKELNANIRSRFTELYVDEVLDPVELRKIAVRYLNGVLPASDRPPEHTDVIIGLVDVYLKCRELADNVLVDGSGQRPRFSLRTLTRALSASRTLSLEQKIPLKRALFEGFELAFQGPLDAASVKVLSSTLASGLKGGLNKQEVDQPGRRPGGRGDASSFILIKPFWIKTGPLEQVDFSNSSKEAVPKFILTETTLKNLRRLVRAVVSGPWPILLEGPTGAGKTNLIQYLAARCGHHVIRINNHEHTDVQEYTGGYASDSSGSLTFQDGLLVHALRRGHWVILDELNLAPSDVLEALNRLLDDNRELYLPETNEIVKPHPNFRLFATQNPSGAYGGRKPLSRAFRNRFVELHVADLPAAETVKILEERCACPPSHAKLLVSIMEALRRRRSRSGLFLGKDGIITPRDLLRWAHRGVSSKLDLAREGYMLLAERLRTHEEKEIVREDIEAHLCVKVEIDQLYYGKDCATLKLLNCARSASCRDQQFMRTIAPTNAFLRLVKLVSRCIEQREPVLLVGDTGNGKTTVVQLLSLINNSRLHIVNCHATTETADLLGGLRPLRGRSALAEAISTKVREFLQLWPDKSAVDAVVDPSSNCAWSFLNDEADPSRSVGSDDVSRMVKFVNSLCDVWCESRNSHFSQGIPKRLKLELMDRSETTECPDDVKERLLNLRDEIRSLYQRYHALFEWVDGPLVEAMKGGDYILLDEMSLADDAVLERLNSVLEPSRTLVLAEKGSSADADIAAITAREGFQLFATMNPGGDFGKRELSPALRNRFTEIWVPQITDSSDIDLVLERSLAGQAPQRMKVKMMEYLDWFNNAVCFDPLNPNDELSLSLRDVLTWADFIVAASKSCSEVGIWEIYRQGAYLMHLDGIGLGTGVGKERADDIRSLCEDFLSTQLSEFNHRSDTVKDVTFSSGPFRLLGDKFGKSPFWIDAGSYREGEPKFLFDAPTTSVNLYRILRALQLSKPVLLEGPPGTGKTGIVEALAAAAGHRLVRINLSEQSDISDLFGSDLPIPGENTDSPASFQWCDGVLLSAIKAGDWVLLDELNLAPQSVLEGLNSCLDHRSNVYVPEVGLTFNCPKSFRVFAAQNPLSQGGGRKGLPKSFLNRFTKVYVAPLTPSDFSCIVQSRFPGVSQSIAESMIEFNSRVHRDATESMTIGTIGGPWEFNLRDIFRWCDLLTTCPSESPACSRFARDLYVQRFRKREDREVVISSYEACFADRIPSLDTSKVDVTRSTLKVGNVVLPRNLGSDRPLYRSIAAEPSSVVSLVEPQEAVARCVSMRWPCLLVGSSRDAIASIVKGLAESAGAEIIEICLSASSDVSELVGCFEQVNVADKCRDVIQSLVDVAVEYAAHPGAEEASRVLDCILRLSRSSELFTKDAIHCAINLGSLLSHDVCAILGERSKNKVESSMKTCIEFLALLSDVRTTKGLFVWKDGPLVKAMSSGYWIHLKNVNLCPATVLDRLNPVLEPGGNLLLAECGTSNCQDLGEAHRQLKPNPKFMVFLSMDPVNGEISRAMRNRCVEVFVPGSLNPVRSSVDALSIGWGSGLRVSLAGSHFFQKWQADGASDIIGLSYALGKCLSSSLLRGVHQKRLQHLHPSFPVIASSVDVSGLVFENGQVSSESHVSALSCPSLRDGWLVSPVQARLAWEGRVLRSLVDCDGRRLIASGYTAKILSRDSAEDTQAGLLRNVLLNRFLCRQGDFIWRSTYLARLFVSSGTALRCLVERCVTLRQVFGSSAGFSPLLLAHGTSVRSSLEWFVLRRGPQYLEEEAWLNASELRASEGHQLRETTVLRVSYFLFHGTANSVSCSITPILLPLFRAFDDVCVALFDSFLKAAVDEAASLVLTEVLTRRDELWNLLSQLKFIPEGSPLVQFEETEFIVQWSWFRKSLTAVEEVFLQHLDMHMHHLLRKLNDLVVTIDITIFGSNGKKAAARRSIQKKISRPLVPRTTENWSLALSIQELGRCFSIPERFRDDFECVKVSQSIELTDLVARADPVLFAPLKLKREVVAVLCMAYMSSLEGELGPLRGSLPCLDSKISLVLRSELQQATNSFTEKVRHTRMERMDSSCVMTDAVDVQNSLNGYSMEKQNLPVQRFEQASDDLLTRFARIQLSPLAEYWCEFMERNLVEVLCGTLLGVGPPADCQPLLSSSSLSQFIDFSLTHSQWEASEIHPYEILFWLAEMPGQLNNEILKCILPSITSNALRHTWCGSGHHFDLLSYKLELPILLGAESRRRAPGSNSVLPKVAQGHVPAALVFSMVGKEFRSGLASSSVPTFVTIENFRARELQTRELLYLLARIGDAAESRPIHELSYGLLEIVHALGRFPGGDGNALVELLTNGADPEDAMPNEILIGIRPALEILEFPERIVLSTWRCIRRAWRCEGKDAECMTRNPPSEDLAVARVYLGLLRFHMLLPESPIDPGRRPLGEVNLLDRRLSRLSVEESALRLESYLTCGEFDCEVESRNLRTEIQELLETRSVQEAKIIKRPEDCPPFMALYHEIHAFSKRFMDIDSMEEFVELLSSCRTGNSQFGCLLQRELHWQGTAESYCNRLLSKFAAYEDVVIPLVEAIGNIKTGRMVLKQGCCCDKPVESAIVDTMTFCSQVPMRVDGIDRIMCRIGSLPGFLQDSSEKRDLFLAFLSRLVLSRFVLGTDRQMLLLWHSLVEQLLSTELMSLKNADGASTDDEVRENEYLHQFPDYRQAFDSLSTSQEEEESEPAHPVPTDGDDMSTVTDWPLQDDELKLLQRMHRDFFSEGHRRPESRIRSRAFRLSYNFAFRLYEVLGHHVPPGCNNSHCGHAMALAMCTVAGPSPLSAWHLANFDDDFVDFHRDPCPSEVSKAAVPLGQLLARVIQLLNLFPDNSVLVAILKVTERVRRLNLLSASLGQVMIGLEVILKNAQDWEQHASERFRIGEPLSLVSSLVANWRKLELQSWSRLLCARERLREKCSWKHWVRLHKLLRPTTFGNSPGNIIDLKVQTNRLIPPWLWKGCAAEGQKISMPLETVSADFAEVVKAIDSFILTASIGEFETRLDMIRSFALQHEFECRLCDSSHAAVSLSRSLWCIWSYYNQFSCHVAERIAESRKPFEKQLAEQAKLAKWDDQTYYSLVESSDRNHRKLMSILKGYDEALDLNVGIFLEVVLCNGIRPTSNESNARSTSISSLHAMFPHIGDDILPRVEEGGRIDESLVGRRWEDATVLGASAGSYCSRIGKLSAKIESVQSHSGDTPSCAVRGHSQACTVSSAIFNRIEALRSEKVTRPMKERALADLLKELKNQGFSSCRWSTPKEIGLMSSVFQLPGWRTSCNAMGDLDDLTSTLASCDSYTQRCLAEASRFRNEIAVIGCRHLTSRQMAIMLNMAENGLLLLCQQRCLLLIVLCERERLASLMTTISCEEKSLPVGQSELASLVRLWLQRDRLATETVAEIVTFLRSMSPLVIKVERVEKIEMFIQTLESYLQNDVAMELQEPLVVTERDVLTVRRKHDALHALITGLQSFLQDNSETIPLDTVDNCLSLFRETLSSSKAIIEFQFDEESVLDSPSLSTYVSHVSDAVESLLLSVQASTKCNAHVDTDGSDSIWGCHKILLRTWANVNVQRIAESLSRALGSLKRIHDEKVEPSLHNSSTRLASDLLLLIRSGMISSDLLIRESLSFHREVSKLQYVLLRVFRVLVSKGFCSSREENDADDSEEGLAGGATFEDKEGTGMGEGDGSKDVTDQLENEEQILGLKGDANGTEKNQEKPKELGKEELETGMEMEADFEGDVFDMPRHSNEGNDDSNDDEEANKELEREMGDEGGLDEEVVDEKIWNEDTEEDESTPEKLEDNSNVRGEGLSDEMITKGGAAEDGPVEEPNADPVTGTNRNDAESEKQQENLINEDTGECHEENHGIQVSQDEVEKTEEGDGMDFDEHLSLDGDDCSTEEQVDPCDEKKAEDNNEEEAGLSDEQDREPEEPSRDEQEDGQDHSDAGIDRAQQAFLEETDALDSELQEQEQREEPDPPHVHNREESKFGLGVSAQDGKDAVDPGLDDAFGDGNAEIEQTDGTQTDSNDVNPHGEGQSEGGGMQGQTIFAGPDETADSHDANDVPNPLRNPGDASKYWHRKLNVIRDLKEEADVPIVDPNDTLSDPKDVDGTGDFEHTNQIGPDTTQALGEVDDKDAVQLDQEDTTNRHGEALNDTKKFNKNDFLPSKIPSEKKNSTAKENPVKNIESLPDEANEPMEWDPSPESLHDENERVEPSQKAGNQVVSDLSQLQRSDDSTGSFRNQMIIEEDCFVESEGGEITQKAHEKWSLIQSETHHLSRRLCEKLRLVMEPLVASKLRGDYRTGKRINMKRVIGYIASGYRRDKIWLRRTKPAKRNYRVLVAVDDSESMRKTGAGDMALRAMATLATGMSHLEVGQIGLASFGDEMHILHPFDQPFTPDCGPNIVQSFTFSQKRTRTSLCVESTLKALDTPGDYASMQLVFMISDGRIERDSRANLRRLLREMLERNILLALIVVEGEKKKDSILNMKEVTFQQGKPHVKRFIEDYPFPYYIILDDMQALPEVLGDALRQWFEMLARLQDKAS